MIRPVRLAAAALLLLLSCGDDDDGPGGQADAGGPAVTRVQGYLKPAPYPKLVIELDAVPGVEPRASSSAFLRGEIAKIAGKPGGITVMQTSGLTSRGADHAWTFAELQALADSTFDLAVGADTTKMHVLFLDGHHADDTSSAKILGVAWSNTHLAMFKATLEATCASALPLIREKVCSAAEQSVWLHEIGHVVGLVDNGLPMVQPHADGAHPGHDSSDKCVMYWAYEGQGAVDALIGQITGGQDGALAFDARCLADLAAVRDAP